MIQTAYPPCSDPQPDLDDRYNVIVIGGGPAGATTATLVAEHGHRTLLLERSGLRRFHVGESLIPETYWTLERLGLIERLKQSAFPKKYSVQFISENGKESAPFYFDDYKQHESSVTWQVVRGEFDKLLLDNAAEKGAVVCGDAQVLDVSFEGERATGVRVKLKQPDGSHQTRTIACDVVVDATGQSAFLANRLGLRTADPMLKKGSIWTYWSGAQRDAGRDEGATLIISTRDKKAWFWYIPLPDDVVSVGVTGDMSYLFGKHRESAEATYLDEVARCPGLEPRLANALRCTDYFTTKDFSYRASRAAGDGWVLVGDAFGFLDPVYSSGVFLALKSGEFAADAIHEAFATRDFTAARLGSWQQEFIAGMNLFRNLVYAFYTPQFNFARFLREHPQYRNNLVDILIGDVFKPSVGEMFDAMAELKA